MNFVTWKQHSSASSVVNRLGVGFARASVFKLILVFRRHRGLLFLSSFFLVIKNGSACRPFSHLPVVYLLPGLTGKHPA